MSVTVSIAIIVSSGEDPIVNVGRVESVLPVTFSADDGSVTQSDVDLIDLTRSALDRLASDAFHVADDQVRQMRALLEGEVSP